METISRESVFQQPWFEQSQYHFKSHFFDTPSGKIHYLDEGSGSPIVFVHGTPSWSFEFRHQISELSKTHRCLALDHLGFGFSDRPKKAPYGIEFYRKQFEAWLTSLKLPPVTLVVHDFGGPIALPVLVEKPGLIKKVVILNSWFWPFENTVPRFKLQKYMIDNPIMRYLYLKRNFSAEVMIKSAWGKKNPLSSRLHDCYRKVTPSPEATWSFAQAVVKPGDHYERFNWVIERLQSMPVQIIWGMADKFVTPIHLDEWKRRLPKAKIHPLEGVGHFPADEAAQDVTGAVAIFLAT